MVSLGQLLSWWSSTLKKISLRKLLNCQHIQELTRIKTHGKETCLLKSCGLSQHCNARTTTGPCCTSNALDKHLSICILINSLRECMHALLLSLLRGMSPEQVWAKFIIKELAHFQFISWNIFFSKLSSQHSDFVLTNIAFLVKNIQSWV